MGKVTTKTAPRWLLISNCQTMGLSNCIGMVNPGIEIEYCDFPKFRKAPKDYLRGIESYDRVLTAPQFLSTEAADLSRLKNLVVVPTVYFDAYHPDLCLVFSGNTIVKGPLSDYHSSIAFAAYMQGLDERATKALFNARSYASFGFFGRWQQAKERLLAEFSTYDLGLASAFSGWSRNPSAFMHSVNHPSIRCLYDVARAIVQSQGFEDQSAHLMPHDNLLNGPGFPVYDEIAEHYSVHGSYRFKLAGQYSHIGLEQFIRGCFDAYDQHDKSSLAVAGMYRATHANIVERLQEGS